MVLMHVSCESITGLPQNVNRAFSWKHEITKNTGFIFHFPERFSLWQCNDLSKNCKLQRFLLFDWNYQSAMLLFIDISPLFYLQLWKQAATRVVPIYGSMICVLFSFRSALSVKPLLLPLALHFMFLFCKTVDHCHNWISRVSIRSY